MVQETPPITVFVLDDEPRVAKAITQSIQSLGVKVLTFTGSLECLEAIKNTACDLLVTDVNMPHMDGIAVLKAAREAKPILKVMVVTGHGDIPMAVKAVKEGALNFFEKPLDEESFIPAVKEALRSIEKAGAASELTDAEMQVLQLVASGKSNKEIAYLLDRSIRTIENHRHRLMKKLGADSPASLTKIAIALGISTVE